MRGWIIIFTLLFGLAVAEISLTAFLVERFGIWKLVIIYAVTTTVGFTCLWLHRDSVKSAFNEKLTRKERQVRKRRWKTGEFSSSDKSLMANRLIGLFYVLALVLFVIPGLVTDIAGFVMLIPWLQKKYIHRSIQKLEWSAENLEALRVGIETHRR